MIELGVNIDHVATLRQVRGTPYPSPLEAALTAETAGADAITLHPREDRRHIQTRDVELVAESLRTRMNLELAVSEANLALAERLRPYCVLLVPENRKELTTEGGLDVVAHLSRVREACARMAQAGVRVSIFVDAEPAQLEAARECGAPMVEVHTGHYADAAPGAAREAELQRVCAAVRVAQGLGLEVNAGHGLNYHNVQPVAALPGVRELNIGHAIVAHALFVGWAAAVREMKALMREAAARAQR